MFPRPRLLIYLQSSRRRTGERSATFCVDRGGGGSALPRFYRSAGRLCARGEGAQGVSRGLSPGVAVGLSARLLCALQPVQMLVRDHVSAWNSQPADT
jgi:hypothetical protein